MIKRDTENPNNKVIAANSNNIESYYSSGYNLNFQLMVLKLPRAPLLI